MASDGGYGAKNGARQAQNPQQKRVHDGVNLGVSCFCVSCQLFVG